jgi:hypothetical protein
MLLFPSKKQELIGQVMVAFDAERANEVKAACLIHPDRGLKFGMETFLCDQARTAAALTSVALPSSVSIVATASNPDRLKKIVSSQSLADLWTTNLEHEKDKDINTIDKKRLMAKITDLLMAAPYVNQAPNSGIKLVTTTTPGMKVALHELQVAGDMAQSKLYYYGRVVDSAAALLMKRHFTIPLVGDGCQDLYIDGSSNLNPQRSDFCAAFMVGKPRAKDVIVSFESSVEADVEKAAAAADAQTETLVTVDADTTPRKKRKIVSPAKLTHMLTHKLDFEKMEVTIQSSTGTDLTFLYNRPLLVPIASAIPIGTVIMTSRTDWDEVEKPATLVKTTGTNKGFVLT